jgi:hypothetical protein
MLAVVIITQQGVDMGVPVNQLAVVVLLDIVVQAGMALVMAAQEHKRLLERRVVVQGLVDLLAEDNVAFGHI